MAFLDNSGDIILDAVLTDVGRKRMARGNFQITKFALGDDEIDYGLYDKNHPSGSAYYDLQILQTPILEAFTQTNASLNYGLVTYTRNDLLYLPTIVLNNKNASLPNVVVKHPDTNIVYLADDSKSDLAGNITSTNLKEDMGNSNSIIIGAGPGAGSVTGKYLVVETGLNTDKLKSTAANQNSYLLAMGLNDSTFSVSMDGRWLTSIFGPTIGSSFQSSGTGAELSLAMTTVTSATVSSNLNNYTEVLINGMTSRLYPATDHQQHKQLFEYYGPARSLHGCRRWYQPQYSAV